MMESEVITYARGKRPNLKLLKFIDLINIIQILINQLFNGG